MKKCISLLFAAILIFTCINTSAAPLIYKEGTSLVFHNASPYYIVDDVWIEGENKAELRDGVLFVSLSDFQTAFRCNLTYSYEDFTITVLFPGKTLKQTLGDNTLFINDVPYPVAAPYISSAEGHPVMIALEPYASTIGYIGAWSESEIYPPGQMSLSMEKVPYTISSIEVNQAAQLVTIMGKSPSGNIEPVKHMLCSTGVGTLTPNGTFKVTPLGTNWYYFPLHNCFVLYCSQLTGNICFHSLTFNLKDVNSLSRTAYKDIGTKASHGCIRLFVEDAKFIHQNCKGLPVTISPGFVSPETDAIRAQLLATKLTYEEYVKSLN